MRALLNDLRALERMLAGGLFETGIRRIGAEQEVFLVDRAWHAAPVALELLEKLGDPAHYTTEFGLFNLEMNLDPQVFSGGCLRRVEEQLDGLVSRLRGVAAQDGIQIVLVGILPTIRKTDLGIENMTPKPRYIAINQALSALRGGPYEIHIKGIDELRIKHDSAMVETCNASFQLHFQVGPAEFANLYNIAQVALAPVLAAAANSPLLFGKRLWAESRIALFQQAIDTRRTAEHVRERSPRVTFGTRWVRESVTELYKEDIAKFRTLVGTEMDEDPQTRLDRGEIPELKALRLHNGTVYRWNRPCYGITDGRPHLRIENRVLPSGPTVADQIANAAFWYGLISDLSDRTDDVTRLIDFELAAANFLASARQGLGAHFTWLEGEEIAAPALILDRLLPGAHAALSRRGIDAADLDRYLGIIEKRVRSGMTGSRWLLQSLARMQNRGTHGERLNALTTAMIARQTEGAPVHQWPYARLEEAGGWKHNYYKVEQYMTTDIVSVHEDEPVELVANLMEWERIRHIPVEDHDHRLVGIVSYRAILRLLGQRRLGEEAAPVAVAEIMRRDPIVVEPDAPTLEAIDLMRRHKIGALPVVQDGRLVGIVTEHDFMDIAAELLEWKLLE